MAISNTAITSSNTTIFTSSGNNAITTMIFCNTSAYVSATPALNQSLLYVYAVPNGGSIGTGTLIINGLPIPAGETVSMDQEKLVLGVGDSVQATASYAWNGGVGNITATVSSLAV